MTTHSSWPGLHWAKPTLGAGWDTAWQCPACSSVLLAHALLRRAAQCHGERLPDLAGFSLHV